MSEKVCENNYNVIFHKKKKIIMLFKNWKVLLKQPYQMAPKNSRRTRMGVGIYGWVQILS